LNVIMESKTERVPARQSAESAKLRPVMMLIYGWAPFPHGWYCWAAVAVAASVALAVTPFGPGFGFGDALTREIQPVNHRCVETTHQRGRDPRVGGPSASSS
jgi:hypothetical protein